MKRLLAIAVLLAASTAHAETYICTLDKKVMYHYNDDQFEWEQKYESTPKNKFVFETKDGGSTYVTRNMTQGGFFSDCDTSGLKFDLDYERKQLEESGTVICRNNYMQIRFNKQSLNYIRQSTTQLGKSFYDVKTLTEFASCEEFHQ